MKEKFCRFKKYLSCNRLVFQIIAYTNTKSLIKPLAHYYLLYYCSDINYKINLKFVQIKYFKYFIKNFNYIILPPFMNLYFKQIAVVYFIN